MLVKQIISNCYFNHFLSILAKAGSFVEVWRIFTFLACFINSALILMSLISFLFLRFLFPDFSRCSARAVFDFDRKFAVIDWITAKMSASQLTKSSFSLFLLTLRSSSIYWMTKFERTTIRTMVDDGAWATNWQLANQKWKQQSSS